MTDAAPDPRLDPCVQQTLRELGSGDADELRLGGLPARELLTRFGSPLYVFDLDALRARAAFVQQTLGARVRLLYSVKANPSLAVATTLRRCGIGIEVASLGEFELALAAGHAPSAVRFAGPGKTDRELATTIARGIGVLHAESADEVDAIAAAARARGTPQGIAVRVNLAQELHGARLRMSGKGSRFGVDQDQVPALLQRIAADPSLQLRGLHVYAGTQGFDAAAFLTHARALLEQAAQWERELSLSLDELDLGGGFGIAHYLGDPQFDLATAARGLDELLRAHDRPGRAFFVELGRFLTAPMGVYLATVVRGKTSATQHWAVLDGGLHHNGVAAGVGTVLRRPPLCVPVQDLRAAATVDLAIGGPLCTPQDQFAAPLRLPPCPPGRALAVLNAGAYGLTYSSTGFLSHAAPAEVAVENGAARIVRARGEPADVLRGQAP